MQYLKNILTIHHSGVKIPDLSDIILVEWLEAGESSIQGWQSLIKVSLGICCDGPCKTGFLWSFGFLCLHWLSGLLCNHSVFLSKSTGYRIYWFTQHIYGTYTLQEKNSPSFCSVWLSKNVYYNDSKHTFKDLCMERRIQYVILVLGKFGNIAYAVCEWLICFYNTSLLWWSP